MRRWVGSNCTKVDVFNMFKNGSNNIHVHYTKRAKWPYFKVTADQSAMSENSVPQTLSNTYQLITLTWLYTLNEIQT